jgi:hypothetical protein
MLAEPNLLGLRDRDLHPAHAAAAVGHRGEDDVALLVQPRIETGALRLKLLLQLVNRLVEGIEVAAVARLVVFVTRKDELLQLPHYVYLAFHLFFSVYSRIFSNVSAESMCSIRQASLSAMRRFTPSLTRNDLSSLWRPRTSFATRSPFGVRLIGEYGSWVASPSFFSSRIA